MIKKLLFITVLFSLVFALSCNNDKKSANTKSSSKADVKKGVAPVADNEIAVVETDFGSIKIELYSNIAPQMVARFKELAKEGYYDGIAFHRINNTVIQAGNSNTKPGKTQPPGQPEGDSGKPDVPAEFSDVPYTTGIVGAARLGNDVNSANSQFFIMLKPEPQFNQNYTVFGKVIEGMNNVVTISGVPKEGEKPIDAVRIKSISIQPK
jgi:cyclophilin family peptidyl-prolyl cis-trans isomerase